ncbi:MAG: ABC transporter permease [Chloroflexi bacterium]|nr:ABC transporter permease [Chloroflexota bacterium]
MSAVPDNRPVRGPAPGRPGPPPAPSQPRSPRFRLSPSLFVGLALLLAVVGVAVFADLLAPANPARAAGPALQPPSARYWFGTDDLGRDVLSRIVYGSRVSLLVGMLVALTSGLVGTLVGGVAGYLGGWTDDGLMRLTELVQVLPRFFLAILIAALFGSSVWLVAVLLGLTFWPSTARLVRAQVLSLRAREFVVAARSLGASEARVLRRHLLPNALSVVLVSTALQVGGAILVEAGLSFLGLSDPTVVSWGAMLNTAQPFFRTAWWLSVCPGIAILATVLGANLVADGLQDHLGRLD